MRAKTALILIDCVGGPTVQRLALGKTLSYCGWQVAYWFPQQKSTFDIFAETEPDLFFGTTYGVDSAVFKCIKSRPQMKTLMYCSNWGTAIKDIPLDKYPITVPSDNEKRIIEQLKPDFVWIHHPQSVANTTINGWNQLGIPHMGIGKAADVLTYYKGKREPRFLTDLSFFGSNWGYKARTIDPVIKKLVANNYKLKIFGGGGWNIPQYLGYIDDEDAKNLFASSKINLNMYEEHSLHFPCDYNERSFKVIAAGGFCLEVGYCPVTQDVFKDKLPWTSNNELLDAINTYLKDDELRTKITQSLQDGVISNHTYFHRLEEVMHKLGWTEEANNINKKYLEWKNANCKV